MRRQTHVLHLPPLVDAEGIQLAATQVLASIADGRTDSTTGRLLLWAIQMAHDTLGALERQDRRRTGPKHANVRRHNSNKIYQVPVFSFDSVDYLENDS
jgi:hypothetical protein